MKLLTIGVTYGGGGPGATTKYVHEALIESGFESIVACAICQSKDKGVETVYNKTDYYLYRLFRHFNKRCKIVSTIASYRIINLIRTKKPDLIHIRVIHHSFINHKILFKYLSKTNIPLVFTLHDMWLMTGGCYHFIDCNCNKYQNECDSCQKQGRLLDNAVKKVKSEFIFKREFIKNYDNVTIVAVSSWVKDCIEMSFLRNCRNVLIYNSIDTTVFYPRERIEGEKYVVIGVANTWSKNKGIEDYIYLAKILPKEYEIHLIGNVPEDYDLPENIICLGHIVSKDRIAELYSSADVYVSLSYQETFGMTIAEAACCGKITIGYNTSAIPEIIALAHGIVVKPGDVEKIRDEIINVCSNKLGLTDIQIKEIHHAFSKERLVSQHLELYKSLTNNQ